MSELQFPEIVDPIDTTEVTEVFNQLRPTAVAVIDLAAHAVEPLQALEAPMRALVERHRAVAYDLKTSKGLNEAKLARAELREQGRYAVQRACAKFKSDANEAKRQVEALSERLIAIVAPCEEAIDKQIKAREAEIERDKAEKARIEAERIAKHAEGIAAIRNIAQRCQGLPSERIAKAIAVLEGMTFGPSWQEYAVPAASAQCETLEEVRQLYAAALVREEDARRVEAQRIENERIAAELAAQRAELERQAEEQRKAAEALLIAQRAAVALTDIQNVLNTPLEDIEPMPDIDPQQTAPQAQPEPLFEDGPIPAGARGSKPEPEPQVEAAAEAPYHEVSIPDLNAQLGLGMFITRGMLAQFGIRPCRTYRNNAFYRGSGFARLCDALITHIQARRAN